MRYPDTLVKPFRSLYPPIISLEAPQTHINALKHHSKLHENSWNRLKYPENSKASLNENRPLEALKPDETHVKYS